MPVTKTYVAAEEHERLRMVLVRLITADTL